MGWIALFVAILAVVAFLRLTGVRGGALSATGAALMIGAAGYALQGQPDLKGVSATTNAAKDHVPLAEARHAFYGNFSGAESWLTMSEALGRSGKTDQSVGLMQNAVRRHPGDPQLWIGLGNALVDHSNGLTPPADFAFRRAAAIDPAHPAPPFFYGLALARSGNPAGAVAVWQSILDNAPADASWRPLVEAGVAALSGAPPPQAPAG
jgi:cytochrome c-type biogenesis protein CcmH